LDKHALASFSKTSNSTRPLDSYYFEVFEKITREKIIQNVPRIYHKDIMINSDMFKNLLIYNKFKDGAHAAIETTDSRRLFKSQHAGGGGGGGGRTKMFLKWI
jgi:hypothetical protein